jgi:biotin operon repressor
MTHGFGNNPMKAQAGLVDFEEDWGFEAPAQKEPVPVRDLSSYKKESAPVRDLSSYKRVGYTLQKEQGLTATELIAMNFPDQMWVVPNLLPEGLAILAGKPKAGKSWLALNLALAAASGGEFLNTVVAAIKVAYLCLEDSERRLRERLETCNESGGFQLPDNLRFFVEWPQLDDGGFERLEELLQDGYKLAIIDTFQHIRGGGGGYAQDYRILKTLKGMADQYGATILVLHHQRKAKSKDIVDVVLGSTGLTGAADTIWVLRREGENADSLRFLSVTGRDVEDTEVFLTFTGVFEVISSLEGGKEKAVRLTPQQEAVYELFEKEPDRNVSPEELAGLLSVPVNAVNKILLKLKRKGLLVQPEYGRYALPKADRADQTEENPGQKGTLPTLPTLPAVNE